VTGGKLRFSEIGLLAVSPQPLELGNPSLRLDNDGRKDLS